MKTCRLCLGNKGEVLIFDENLSLLNRILSCCKLNVYKNDGFPEYACIDCVEKLENVVSFINQCEESDRILRINQNIIDRASNIKTEIEDLKEEFPIEFKEENLEINLITDTFNFDNITNDTNNEDLEEILFSDCKDSTIDEDESKRKKIKLKKKNKRDIFDKSEKLCPICSKHFTKNCNYKQHLKTHEEKNFVCDKCPMSFFLKNKLKEHKMTHSLLRKHNCEFCDKTYKTKSHAKYHMEYVHSKSKPLPCRLCGKVFYRLKYLKTHMGTHTAEKRFECELCHKTYSQRYMLTAHLRVHTGERPYACRFCNSKFSVLQSLKEHERLHTGETPYKCPTCLKGFAQKGNMKSHFRYNHKDLDFKKTMMEMRQNQLLETPT